jgi:hypothetical protein
MFYVLNFSTHQFVSADFAEQALSAAKDLVENGLHPYEIEIVSAFDDGQRFGVEEFEESWS